MKQMRGLIEYNILKSPLKTVLDLSMYSMTDYDASPPSPSVKETQPTPTIDEGASKQHDKVDMTISKVVKE